MSVKIKYIPTGFEFEVAESYATELLGFESENFVAVDGFKLPERPVEPTIYDSIVVENKKEITKKKKNYQ